MKDRRPKGTPHMTAPSPHHLMSLFAARAAAGDADALLALYEPDAVFEPHLGTVLRGPEQIRAALAGFAALHPVSEYTGTTACVIVDGVALVASHWTVTGQRPDGGAHREAGV